MTKSILRQKRAQDCILAGLSVALFISPWVLNYDNARADWCAWISAVLLAYFVAVSLFDASLLEAKQWEEWATAAVGLWLILAPWILGFSSEIRAERAYWALGALTIIVSLWAEWSLRHPPSIAQH